MTDLERALETDVALSERQLMRHYGNTLEACRQAGLTMQSALIAPTVHRQTQHAVNFVLLETRERTGFELRHLAAIAEARHLLQADTRDWQTIEHANRSSPDAVWQRDGESWAVEFDAGAYAVSTLLEKVQAFEAGFDG
ncbi:MAG: hypothetical protein HC933_04395, partial [Pleurocapsa sp. SU_196_0]|nr:hypothetical protein [Pleurocapsa sp. SU_196_0]